MRSLSFAVVVEAVVVVDANAFELRVHHEVHDAGDGVGAVHRRRAAREHVDALHERQRNLVEVGCAAAVRIARHQAPAVDEDQGALRAEAAKVNRRGTVRSVGNVRALRSECLRELVENVFDARLARDVQLFGADRSDRADALKIRGNDARTGNDHFIHRIACVLILLLRERTAKSEPPESHSRGEQVERPAALIGV